MNSKRRNQKLLVLFMLLAALIVACERPLRDTSEVNAPDSSAQVDATVEVAATPEPEVAESDPEDTPAADAEADDTEEADPEADDTETDDTTGEDVAEAEPDDSEATTDDATEDDASQDDASEGEGVDDSEEMTDSTDDGDTAGEEDKDEEDKEEDAAEDESPRQDEGEESEGDTEEDAAEGEDSADTADAETDAEEDAAEDDTAAADETQTEEGAETAATEEEATEEQIHVIRAGENLYQIGLQYGISWVTLAEYNNLANPNDIEAGQTLRIPPAGGGEDDGDAGDNGDDDVVEEVLYVVQFGDTLNTIGARYGVSWVQIAEANGIVNPNQIFAGQTLKIPVDSPGPQPEFTHVVEPGETLYLISLQYGVAWPAIAEANGLTAPYVIYYGQSLIIPGGE